jgi:hypothetical protein
MQEGRQDRYPTPRSRRWGFAVFTGLCVGVMLATLPSHAQQPGDDLHTYWAKDVPFPQPKPELPPRGDLPCFVCYPNPLPTGPAMLCY